ncbi:MAG TPA: ATP-dependent DNA helicase RecG [Alphaproteobacteria bacterium]|mgnify:CR=1 FL=1|nr:ATP-dependent DNA helicase RecG [Alphaproteobacteria bacterium]
MTDYKLFEEYDRLPGVPPKLLSRVKKLCGSTYADLLFHIPHSVIDRRAFTTIENAEAGKLQTLKVVVTSVKNPANARSPFKVYVTDESAETMELLFFNVGNWIKKSFPEGKQMYLSGMLEEDFASKKMLHPEIYPASANVDEIAKLEPVYPLTKAINSKMLSKAIDFALTLVPEKAEFLPEEILNKYNFPSFKSALQELHHPTAPESLEINSVFRKRLAFDELYAWQSVLIESRNRTKIEKGFAHQVPRHSELDSESLESKLISSLPFALTGDQNKVIAEIKQDLQSEHPMLRLVQGDVGAGKTLVAFAAMMQALENGYQACMMAPTEILATQHYLNAQNILEPLGIKTGLLKGKMKVKEKRELLAALADGSIQIVFGTHALIQDTVKLKSASLVVIDEQHRFGVKQRLKLTSLNLENADRTPDVLVMTATPIPRTLCLTAYGDMDLSIIREKPPGRTPIKTTVMPDSKISDIANALNRVMDKGEQIYWVCPLVEESEKSDLMAATQRYEELVSLYSENDVALLHGKMKPKEKDQVMSEFKDGKYKILVSTTVIEVGVDVPNATTMVIEHAERFGLAQLHQLRGRVGRGSLQSNCLLVHTNKVSKIARDRLDIMRQSEDGFLIAEKDLELRGPGETLGTHQSGHVITKVADLQADKELINEARNLAIKSINENKGLSPRVVFLQKLFGRYEAAKLLQSG